VSLASTVPSCESFEVGLTSSLPLTRR
jgi:hypothetical protein